MLEHGQLHNCSMYYKISFNMKSIIIAKTQPPFGKRNSYRRFCKATSSGRFLKKDHLVIYCTTSMLGDALEFLCIVLKI